MSDLDDAMDLSEMELLAFARRVLANHVSGDTEWLQWEDYPLLGERTFARLQEAVETLATDAWRYADDCDRAEDIDSRLLIERATA